MNSTDLHQGPNCGLAESIEQEELTLFARPLPNVGRSLRIPSSGSVKPLPSPGFRLMGLLARRAFWADLEDLQTRIDVTGSHPPLPADLAPRNHICPKLRGQPPLGYPADALGGLGQVESQPVRHDNPFPPRPQRTCPRESTNTSTSACANRKPALCASARPLKIRFTSVHFDTRTAHLVASRSVPFLFNTFRYSADLNACCAGAAAPPSPQPSPTPRRKPVRICLQGRC